MRVDVGVHGAAREVSCLSLTMRLPATHYVFTSLPVLFHILLLRAPVCSTPTSRISLSNNSSSSAFPFLLRLKLVEMGPGRGTLMQVSLKRTQYTTCFHSFSE